MTLIDGSRCLWVLLLCAVLGYIAVAGERRLPEKPPGRFFPLQAEDHLNAPSFEKGQPIVGTTYFYWYDIETGSHIADGDGTDALTTRPADMNDISYKRSSWHAAQLDDMIAAGIEFLLPVFWGGPGQPQGLDLRPSSGDGMWKKVSFPEGEGVVSGPNTDSQMSRYLYFDVDSAFAYDLYDREVEVTITYRDDGSTSFYLEYDNTNPNEGVHEGAFRKVVNVAVKGTGIWKTAEFVLPDCRFMDRCNGADFCLVVLGGDLELAVRKVVVKHMETTGEKK